MNARILQIIVGFVLFFCSTAWPQAISAQPGGCQAVSFAENAVDDEQGRHAVLAFDHVAMLPNLAEIELSESSVDSEEELKRAQKRTASHKVHFSKCHVPNLLSPDVLSKGVAHHPLTQDALQQRAATIRYLQICALAC